MADEADGSSIDADIEQDCQCSCCCDLMVSPTTLNCGHSVCRHCLALWVASKKTVCPVCRQPFLGIPKTNVIIQSMIEKLYPLRYSHRRQEVMQDESLCVSVANFESTLARQLKRNENNALTNGCFFGLVLGVSIVTCIWLGASWAGADSRDYLLTKRVSKWTVADVSLWVSGLGSWAEPYEKRFVDANISGTILLALDEKDLEDVENTVHKKALAYAIAQLRTAGAKAPNNLWDYRALYPGQSLFLAYGSGQFPRTTLLYLYWFNYEDIFVPLVNSCSGGSRGSDVTEQTIDGPLPDLTAEQWTVFLTKATFLPFVIFAEFAWDWMDVHYWISRVVIMSCFIFTLSEAMAIRRHMDIFTDCSAAVIVRRVFASAKVSLLWMVVFFGMSLIWGLTPKLIGDALFYAEVVYTPVKQLKELYDSLKDMYTSCFPTTRAVHY